MIAGATAGAVALSGALSVVAAQAFKGHAQPTSKPPATTTRHARPRTARVHVPGPQSVPAIAGQPAPLQPPAAAPAPAQPQPAAPAAPPQPQPAAPAPPPQTSGGS
jgi:hypothetical protein